MSQNALLSLKNAIPHSYWLDAEETTADFSRQVGEIRCNLAVVGGGFTGLWTALLARQRYPDRRIVLLEGKHCGNAASGRNGGFCAPSISHGVSNALKRWPKEAETLIRLGRNNLDELHQDLQRFGINAEFERQGKLNVATTSWQVDGLRSLQAKYQRFGIECRFFEGVDLNDYLNSPAYTAGLFEPNYALLNPASLVRELRRVCLEQDVEIYEHTPVNGLVEDGDSIKLETAYGVVQADHVALCTNIFTSLLPTLTSRVIPIYDFALTTEPLSVEQLRSIGWEGRYGIADSGNQFHYWRKTRDNRILWGGYDAVYPFASKLDESLTQRPETFVRLAEQFHQTFPQLGRVSFSHAWGGIIDSSARTTMFTGAASEGRIAYALGFTGQGVSASRFAANTMLDILAGEQTERTALKMLSRAPVLFPPEPLRYCAVGLAQRGLEEEDRTGKRNLLLRTMDAFGVGFDS
ncbi:FAD-dependent oxidoreductase [Pseudomonas putida]|uniref:NAD(P)/FAD-dependent oxidoreductase n=1 Tax=Pseudomonas putida TaxID=303 RepID=UPI003344EB3F